MSSSLLPYRQTLPAAFGHPLAVVDLESRFLMEFPSEAREHYRANLDAWFAFCTDFTVNVLSAQERHVAGFVRHQCEVEWVDIATIEDRLEALSLFYDYAIACGASTINPVTTIVAAMLDSQP